MLDAILVLTVIAVVPPYAALSLWAALEAIVMIVKGTP